MVILLIVLAIITALTASVGLTHDTRDCEYNVGSLLRPPGRPQL